ncbi:GerAB/ArcD/ProY family transporter [Paenibacillus planticolens]|uniref:GerAB/ArcD/ProY family transporter n=1 Tax=Paenibacillus planticolens TaxID=2654976 RepID=A0ABX1ZJ20_9BACL|nr:GerAB/ArcD/ProY family transporter [Paenibacillus planticolens]NOU99637.1 GerAB/ArcD/ProY family transporter [Paenibacillus planticolens]
MRISGKQLFWMILTMQLGMTLLLTINPAIQTAKQDAWLSTACATGIGIFIAFVCSRLSLLYPGQTLIDFCRSLFGRYIGYLIIFLYFLLWYSVLAIILRQYSEFIAATILPKTPILVPILGMLLVAIYVTFLGIEAIARCCEILGPFTLLGIAIPLLLSLKNIHINNILPIYVDSGALTILKGALPTSTFLGDCILLLVVMGFVAKPKTGVKPAMFGVASAGLLTSFSTFLIVSIFGHRTASGQTYPYFNLVRYISYFDFFQNLDSFVIAIWIISVFTKVSLYFFVCTYGTAQVFGVQKWRRMMLFVAPVLVLLALIPRDFIDSSVFFPQKIAIPFLFPLQMFSLPLLMWGIAKWKHK